jgi:hypothetical protein
MNYCTTERGTSCEILYFTIENRDKGNGFAESPKFHHNSKHFISIVLFAINIRVTEFFQTWADFLRQSY